MQTTLQQRNRIRKTVLAFGSFIVVLLALLCPSFQWQASAQDPMDDDMEMRPFLRPIGRVGALVNDDFITNSSTDPSYTQLDYPNARLTVANDINNSGNIVGFYQDANSNVHGFFYNRATRSFASIDYDNPVCTTGTDARGINERGEIVGTCTDNPDPTNVGRASNFYGYLLTADGFTAVQVPGHKSTIPQHISSDGGKIAGCFHDRNTSTTMFGMSRDAGGFDFFGGTYGGLDGIGFMNTGVSPDDRVVGGLFMDMSVTPMRVRGYIVRDGEVTTFDYPGATLTQVWDVNTQGDAVGVYRDSAGRVHGYVRSPVGEFTAIDYPGATLTRAFGINTRGDIVGTYIAGGVQHAFVRSAGGARKSVRELTPARGVQDGQPPSGW